MNLNLERFLKNLNYVFTYAVYYEFRKCSIETTIYEYNLKRTLFFFHKKKIVKIDEHFVTNETATEK